MRTFNKDALARANADATLCKAAIRHAPEHFQVEEKLPFEADGEGGHAILLIEKKLTNTDWLAKQLARFAGTDDVAVGYAGLKDRHAVTTQWFTVKLEGLDEPDWSQFNSEHWQIKYVSRHNKKLKRGVLAGNFFSIKLTALSGDREQWEKNLERVKAEGVPNYFGEQRFGHELANLSRAEAWFADGKKPKKRQQKSIYLSAARSWLFNLVLSERIRQGNWNQVLEGDIMQLAGTRSSFFQADNDPALQHRLAQFDIHPTGPLWGRGEPQSVASSRQLELAVLADWPIWTKGLENAGLKQERRALRLHPEQFEWQFDESGLQLNFYLPAGSYATSVLRELAQIEDVSQRNSGSAATFSVVEGESGD